MMGMEAPSVPILGSVKGFAVPATDAFPQVVTELKVV